ncbi:MAG TPA: ABC transporter permease [Cyclobacteriaceae bacterium]|nr:ABC transporter permease [Cyclobacteriaceae bacterium]
MLRNFVLLSLRNFAKNKASATVNLAGLVLGLTSFAILYLYIENEFSYDRMHERPDDVYRVVRDFVSNDGSRVPDATTPPALAPALRAEMTDIETVTRLFPNRGRTFLIQHGDREYYETSVIRVDPYFFEVFNFPLVAGTWDGGVTKNSILITESMVKKYFGDENPLEKILRFNLNGGTDYVVKGILKDIPQNSHFTFSFVIPFESTRNPDTNWDFSSFYTYARLKPGSDPQALLAGVTRLFKEHRPASIDEYHVQKLTDIHLRSHLKWELASNGDIDYVRILVVITIFILFIAGINYINLTTANSVKRAKEVGVRKVTGAGRYTLVRQFIAESVIIAFVALGFSIILVSLVLPAAGDLIGQDLSNLMADSATINYVLPLCALVFGVLSGLYPAIYISSFDPLKVLKGNFYHSTFGQYLRKGLVVFQFAISTILIIGALTIYRQVAFMKEKELGFNKEHIMLLPNVRGGVGTTLKQGDKFEEIRQLPGVIDIARADGVLGFDNSVNGVAVPGGNHITLNFLRADYSFLPVMGVDFKEGRNFSESFVSDSAAIILNETAIRELGISEPVIGRKVDWDDAAGMTRRVTIIGVVKDFHFRSFREVIQPFGFILEVGNGSTFFLKLNARDLSSTIDGIRKVWLAYTPDHPFNYTFQDDHVARFTINDARFGKLFTFFTALAIVIACMGLYGLVISIGEARTKEIGVRKVLGSSVFGILRLLSFDFVKLISIAFVLACPVSWFAMNNWLSSFAYRATPGVEIFLLTGLFTLLIVIVTVGFRTFRIASANPTNALRSE